MKKIMWVVAGALVNQDGNVLLTQRPEGKILAGQWEYPGGKIEPGEIPEESLCRELKEELDLIVKPEDLIPLSFASHRYEQFHLVMPLFLCRRWEGKPVALENQGIGWFSSETVGLDMENVPMPPADDCLSASLRGWAKQVNFEN